MTDRPINMRDFEVRALLGGMKTQHRVVLQNPDIDIFIARGVNQDHPEWIQFAHQLGVTYVKWPFRPGDRLWVREAHDMLWEYEHRDDSRPLFSWLIMPRHISRLTLLIDAVRVQRLQSIREADAIAEGAQQSPSGRWTHDHYQWFDSAKDSYASLWRSSPYLSEISWSCDPWVAALTFRVVPGNIDQIEVPA